MILSNRTARGGISGTGLAVVVVLHALILWGLLQHRLPAPPRDLATISVNVINSRPRPDVVPPPSSQERSQPPPRDVLPLPVSPALSVGPSITVSVPEPVALPPPLPKPVGPVSLGGELAAVCSLRTPPEYPFVSRRLGEQGTVVLQVELDEQGLVAAARVLSSSGHVRLDDAALAAVRHWRCTPSQRDNQPLRSVAQQPFEFVLQKDRP